MRRSFATLLLCLTLATCGTLTPVMAQHNHAAGHNDYSGWATPTISNCCNNQDCGELRDEEVRDTAKGTEIKIEGQWCPVLPKHYITKGKSPDWNKSHACIRKKKWAGCDEGGCYEDTTSPCERLLCYGGKGGV